jgi:glutamate dehydrogenase
VPPPVFDLDKVLALAAEIVGSSAQPLLTEFATAFLRGLERGDPVGERVLASRVASAFAFAQQRAPGEIRVSLESPVERPGRTVLQLLQDDRPFLVDTVRSVLRRLDLRERAFLHPILSVTRDGTGRLRGVAEAPGAVRESQLYVEVSPRTEDAARLSGIEATLRAAMEKVRHVTDDFAPMLAVLRALESRVEADGPRLRPDGVERARRVRTFLDWLAGGHFIFMGLRRYAVRPQGDADWEIELVPGSGLGLFRDDADSRLREPTRGAAIPDELRDILDDPRILVVGKSRIESPIQRAGRLDQVALHEYDETGRPCTLVLIFGLFTSQALRTPGSKIPLLSSRLEQILRDESADHRSHRHRAIFDAFDSAPIEVLLGTDVDGVSALVREIVESEGAKSARLVLRADRHGRSFYAAVLLPRARYSEELRGRVRALIEARTGATYIDDRASFIEEGTAVLHFFCTSRTGALRLQDPEALEAEIQTLAASWEERFFDALVARFGDRDGTALAARYEDAFPDDLRAATHPLDAVRDVAALEAPGSDGDPRFALYFGHEDAERATTTLRIFLPVARLLSDLLPVADAFGLRVVDAQQMSLQPADRPPIAVHTLRVLPLGADAADLETIATLLFDALGAVLRGEVENDALNRLVLGAGLDWRQVDVVRAWVEYFLQIQGALTRPFVRTVLLENPLAVRILVQLHAARLDPAVPEAERAAREERLRRAFEGYRDRITSLNEDRALAGLLAIVEATLRTTAFRRPDSPRVLAFKVDPAAIAEIAAPAPYREIFVHSVTMMGIHIRGGPVARGGLRWSDRVDDLRVEVLGLMRTQMLKNGLIVPVGAKGGFVLKRGGLAPQDARALADEQYRVFVGSLLDLTDDLDPSGTVVPPAGGVRRDGDDPYLVVAADKGTAHLSDTANELATARGFWLGDAFASGGSEGYDHKEYAITARGAWECARHHFAELGIDPDRDSYTAVGIGDMSGDVFGNGLLLMRKVRLLGAFDHRHVFLDPDPDPELAWQERKRLFALPRSSWADYDTSRISPGGGVFARAAKSIELAPALRERFGIGPGRLSGHDLIRALLALDVDLLWNGGIGTYVKASHESNADVSDRANDAVRIDASQLRARVVAEGGNLGFTQPARLEAALPSGPDGMAVRLETDSVDNSAGVDLSDHEVNYKILLAPLVRSGTLDVEQRRQTILAAADDACESVLSHNRGQALALSLDELRSRRAPGAFLRAIESLCDAAEWTPEGLDLPDAKALAARTPLGRGLLRPELAVLLGVAKLVVRRALADSPWSSAPYLVPMLHAYFPPAFRRAWPQAIDAHPLARDITALVVTNRIVDAGGVTLVPQLGIELGIPLADAAAAALLAEDVLDAPAHRAALWRGRAAAPARGATPMDDAGPASSTRATVQAALLELDRGVRAAARYLVRSGELSLDAARVAQLRDGLATLRSEAGDLLTPAELEETSARRDGLEADGLAPELAAVVTAAALADRALNVLRVCDRANVSPRIAGRVVARLGEGTGILWVHQRLREIETADSWERLALADLRWELLDLQRALAEDVLAAGAADADSALDAFLTRHRGAIEQVRALEEQAGPTAAPSALVVIAHRLRALRS